MPRWRALPFLLPALGMGVLLALDLARPGSTLARYARPDGPPADLSDLPARAADWAGPLSRLRGWASAAGVGGADWLLAVLALALAVAASACLWGFWRGEAGPEIE